MKKVLLFILMLIPVYVNAVCDNSEIVNLGKLASNITYDTEYSKSLSKYTVTFYNVVEDIYLEYNDKKYSPNQNNEVTISDLEEGNVIDVVVYPNASDCKSSLLTISVKLKYYNTFYNDSRCKKYVDNGCSTVYCTNQFLDVKPTQTLFEESLKNTCEEPAIPLPKPGTEEVTLHDKIVDFLLDYGIKFLLIAISLTVSILIFTNKYRKIKHGI